MAHETHTTPFDDAFYASLKSELENNILPFWEKYARDTDTENKGFFAEIGNDNSQDKTSPRSIVMTSRFLWAFSAAARYFKDEKYLEMADFAFEIIMHKYFDVHFGGMYWSVNPDGTPSVSKKQIYGQAFACYGISEYAAALREVKHQTFQANMVIDKALALFTMIETYAKDKENGGYVEACAENWQKTDDMILSEKDLNCPKSMNTNLHVMEAYTNLLRNLYVVYPEQRDLRKLVGTSLKELVHVTIAKILQKDGHLGMFFDMDWNRLDSEISYGHDIEASWLIWEAACELHDEETIMEAKLIALKMADVALKEGMDNESGAFENFMKDGVRDRTRVWWNQAEAINGFYNAWEMTEKTEYADAVKKVWNWVQNYQVDKENGEWFAEVMPDGKPNLKEAKGGNWKTAYHNGRCCLELLRRSGK
mgnify:CR=1 FL=1